MGTIEHAELIQQLAADAEHRGGLDARRGDGAFFTSDDVAAWLAQRACGALALAETGAAKTDVDRWMAENEDLLAHLRRRLTELPEKVARVRTRIAHARVLDPTCGAGAFLLAAWQELRAIERVLDDVEGRPSEPRVGAHQLWGIDADAGAVAACWSTLELIAGPGANVVHADALEQLASWSGTFDLVLGNPPYVRAAVADAPEGIDSAGAGNLAAWIVERALSVCAPHARIAMVMPVSAASSPKWGSFRARWDTDCRAVHAAHFDTIPSSLFPGVVQRLTLLEGHVDWTSPARWYTTRYHRWLTHEREGLLQRVRFVPIERAPQDERPLPKLGTDLEHELWTAIHEHPPLQRWITRDATTNRVHYKRRWSYFLLFTDFVPPIWDADGTPRLPSELQSVGIDERIDARAVVAICNSTLFWWWFSVLTDNRNVNRGDLATFPVPDLEPADVATLATLGTELMVALHASSEVRTCTYRSVGTIRNTYYRQAETRPVLDRIDMELGRLYGMSDDELATVLDYERRFRS